MHTTHNLPFFEEDHTLFYNKSLQKQKNGNPLIKHIVGKTEKIYWFDKNQQSHHDTKPAIIEKSLRSEKIIMWQYLKKGRYHNIDKPAIVDLNAINPYCSWYYNGTLHRIGGFAEMQVNKPENQKPTQEHYNLFLDNKKYEDPNEYFKAAQVWLIKNTNSHDCLEIIEDLHQKLSIGYFDEHNWKNGIFQKNHSKN